MSQYQFFKKLFSKKLFSKKLFSKKLFSKKLFSKKLFSKKLLFNPFYYYRRAAGFTFCFVTITNLTTTLVGYGDPSHYRRDMIKNAPDVYFAGILAKSLYYSALWPSYYLTILQKPKTAFVLAPHIAKKYKRIIKEEEE